MSADGVQNGRVKCPRGGSIHGENIHFSSPSGGPRNGAIHLDSVDHPGAGRFTERASSEQLLPKNDEGTHRLPVYLSIYLSSSAVAL